MKLYGADVESGGVKLNEVVEFIGVLEADPSADFDAPAARDAAAFGMSESEVAALCPPPSRVPRLHCLLHRRLSATDEVIEYAAAAKEAARGAVASTRAANHPRALLLWHKRPKARIRPRARRRLRHL